MARDHARIQCAIWRDKDFRHLTGPAQHVYFTLVSQPTLTYCGVMDWWPNRLASLSRKTEEADIFASIQELMDAKFVLLDVETSELLVRTYVRHDGVLIRKNMGKAMGRALEKVVSLEVRRIVLDELARMYREDPKLAGWDGFSELYAGDFKEVVSIASGM
jgi:hypothetical protein